MVVHSLTQPRLLSEPKEQLNEPMRRQRLLAMPGRKGRRNRS